MIGAGLAGAALAASLTRRGASVCLLDAASGPAVGGASALPVGVLSPHVTAQPTPMSRLSALGFRHTWDECLSLGLAPEDFQPTTIDNRRHDAGARQVALLRPAALVEARLRAAQSSTRVRCIWNAEVGGLHHADGHWRALDRNGQVLTRAAAVFLAAAWGSRLLMPCAPATPWPIGPVRGQLSWGPASDPPPDPTPIRGQGVYVPLFAHPGEGSGREPCWAMGSTFERGQDSARPSDAAHAQNLQHLEALDPQAAQRMRAQQTDGRLRAWVGIRCASRDRLPIAGRLLAPPPPEAGVGASDPESPVPPGLFGLLALGSRGLTLSSLCADHVAQLWLDGSSPLPSDLTPFLDPMRFWRRGRRRP